MNRGVMQAYLNTERRRQVRNRVKNIDAPVITGTAAVGQVLTAADGTWLPLDTANLTFTYAWQRDGVAIGGETASTYTTVAGDSGHTITCVVTATYAYGFDAYKTATAVSNGIDIP